VGGTERKIVAGPAGHLDVAAQHAAHRSGLGECDQRVQCRGERGEVQVPNPKNARMLSASLATTRVFGQSVN